MTGFLVRARTLWALGVRNLLRVAVYRIGLRTGLHPVCRIHAEPPKGPFFNWPVQGSPEGVSGRSDWRDQVMLFGHIRIDVGDTPPDWMTGVSTGRRHPGAAHPWWRIGDFDPAVGDIKAIWELSRFDWLLAMAQRACLGEESEFRRLERWLQDWVERNPPYLGPNWKCGQEASLRVLHLAATAMIFGQVATASPALIQLVRIHLARVAPTIDYAVAQDNNHGTSEAAALFVGGSWLSAAGHPEGRRWMQMGRKWLEERTVRLIGADGTFSQYSLNYHRLMLDTMSFAEAWRRRLGLPTLPESFTERCRAAVRWLRAAVDETSGDGPNVGANDGAHILRWDDSPYRDFRPSLQVAMAVFDGRSDRRLDIGGHQALRWLGIPHPTQHAEPNSDFVADDGGFAWLRRGSAMVLLRYPRFRFRPSQADVLHLDLWVRGRNVLRDGGSFGYNTDADLMSYFNGAPAHNTVEFDDRDAMPRISRFLYGRWAKTSAVEDLKVTDRHSGFGACYVDYAAARHDRRVELSADGLTVIDAVSGFRKAACLRWRLVPGDWRLDLRDGIAVLRDAETEVEIRVEATPPWSDARLVNGWESRHYLEKTCLPVFELSVHREAIIRTVVRWAA
jgi:hypothetical protein